MLKLLSTTDDLKFKHPFSCLLSGLGGSGKSTFCIRFLHNLDALCSERNFDGWVIWCYSEKAAVPNKQLAVLKNIRYNEGVPSDFDNANGKPCLIIFDNMINVYSKEVCDLFTKGSHHRNISEILITQILFHQGRYYRDISLNAKYLVLLKNVRDKKFMFWLVKYMPKIELVYITHTWKQPNDLTDTSF